MPESDTPNPSASSPTPEGPKVGGIHVNLGFADFIIPFSTPVAYLLAAAALLIGISWVYQTYLKPNLTLVSRERLDQLVFEAQQYEQQLNSVQFIHSQLHVASPQEGEPLKSPMKNLGLMHVTSRPLSRLPGDELGSRTMGKLTHTNLQGSATSSRG